MTISGYYVSAGACGGGAGTRGRGSAGVGTHGTDTGRVEVTNNNILTLDHCSDLFNCDESISQEMMFVQVRTQKIGYLVSTVGLRSASEPQASPMA